MADSMINGVNKINTVNYTISLAEVNATAHLSNLFGGNEEMIAPKLC